MASYTFLVLCALACLTQSVLSGLPAPAPHPLAPNEKHVLGLKSGNVELDIDVLAKALAAAGVGVGASASASAAASAAAGASVPASPGRAHCRRRGPAVSCRCGYCGGLRAG
ncbi:hypothetical protein ACJJTC_003023 [Scirpophaga incertulas]